MGWVHRLTNISPVSKTADCQNCGTDVKIYMRPDGKTRCLAAKSKQDVSRWQERRANGEKPKENKSNRARRSLRAKLFDAQEGKCSICGNALESGDLDHCHSTGYVRAVLCRPCNSGLGKFQDNPELLRKAAEYVEYHRANPSMIRYDSVRLT